jgi:hypothetical protein
MQIMEPMANPYAGTFFAFDDELEIAPEQQAFVDFVVSSTLWRDGSKPVLVMVADRHGKILNEEDAHGGLIDPFDPFWTGPDPDGCKPLLERFIRHHMFQKGCVTFGQREDVNDPSRLGAGYFRLSVDSEGATGPLRWAAAEFRPNHPGGPGNDHIVETMAAMAKHGWRVWKFDAEYDRPRSGTDARPFARSQIVVDFREDRDCTKALYWFQKCMKKKFEKCLSSRGRGGVFPCRSDHAVWMIPIFFDPLAKAKITFSTVNP